MNINLVVALLGIVIGFFGLWWSSDRVIEYSVRLSELFGFSTFFVGFIFLAVATGFPELAITVVALWKNVPGIATGTIIGSNLGDVSLVLGLPAVFIGTLNVQQKEKMPFFLMLFITSLVMAFVFILGILTFIHGVILLFLYGVSILWLWKTNALGVVSQREIIEELRGPDGKIKSSWFEKFMLIVKLLFSLVLVLITSKISIDSVLILIQYFPIRLEALGATIFAVGTSLPEIAVSLQAVKKKEYGLAFGNSLGSVLEQATFILGILVVGRMGNPINISVLRPIAPLMFASYAIVAYGILKKTKVGRQEGLGFVEGVLLLILFGVHVFLQLK